MDIKSAKNKGKKKDTKGAGAAKKSDLDEIIRKTKFPDDYEAFEDENLNMLP
jgi:hypothetical protein